MAKATALALLAALALAGGALGAPFFLALNRTAQAGGGGFVFEETFEGTGTVETWTAMPPFWDPDDTSAPIDGSESLYSGSGTGSDSEITIDLGAAYSSFYCVLKFDIISNVSSGRRIRLLFLDADEVAICQADLLLNSSSQVYRVYTYHSGSTVELSDTSFAYLRTDGVLKLEYVAGTGADGYVRSRMTDLSDYAANGWNGVTEGRDTTTSSDTAAVRFVRLDKSYHIMEAIFDSIRGNDTDDVDF